MLKRALSVAVLPVLLMACPPKDSGGGIVQAGDASAIAVLPIEAGAAPTGDISQCAGCAVAPAISWTFQGIYKDDKCTIPLVQADTPACAPVPAVGPASVVFTDAVAAHAANATANITITEQVAPEVARFRKNGAGCVRANEVATDITPMGCAGQRVCRDAAGNLACTGCRTFTNSCPDFEQTRTYAAIEDKPTAGKPTNTNVERLKQCCNALITQGKGMGATPEGMTMVTYGQQCLALVAQAGPSGNAPELAALRPYLQGGNIPAICKGL